VAVVVKDANSVGVAVVVAATRLAFVFYYHWLLKTGQDGGPCVPSGAWPSFDGPLGGGAGGRPGRHGHARKRHRERLVEKGEARLGFLQLHGAGKLLLADVGHQLPCKSTIRV